MSMDTRVIASTNWSKGKKGMEDPFRYVVLARYKSNGEFKEYSRHMEVKRPGKDEPEYYHGNYHQSLDSAMEDLQTTLKNHQGMYTTPSGQSYISGGINMGSSSRRPIKKPAKKVAKKRCKK